MVTERLIEPDDESTLAIILAKDQYHTLTDPEFFYSPGCITKVYEDENGPVLFARASKALRLDLQFMDNGDKKRNLKVLIAGFPDLVQRAKDNGFSELIFNTSNKELESFCTRRFGFVKSDGELRRFL